MLDIKIFKLGLKSELRIIASGNRYNNLSISIGAYNVYDYEHFK